MLFFIMRIYMHVLGVLNNYLFIFIYIYLSLYLDIGLYTAKKWYADIHIYNTYANLYL